MDKLIRDTVDIYLESKNLEKNKIKPPPKKEKKKTDPQKLLQLERGRLIRKLNLGKITEQEINRLTEIQTVLRQI